MNIPDSGGDTAAQLAVVQGDHAVLDLLLPGAALLACNGHGHNLLHIAALKVTESSHKYFYVTPNIFTG